MQASFSVHLRQWDDARILLILPDRQPRHELPGSGAELALSPTSPMMLFKVCVLLGANRSYETGKSGVITRVDGEFYCS